MRIWWPSLLLALLLGGGARADLTGEWYLVRGRANMQIKNYKAAAEAYRKAADKDPGSREALQGLAKALEANGQTDEAIAAWDRYLARFKDDPDAAFKQAHLLGWSRYKYRLKDAIRYYEQGLAVRDDPAQRRQLAKLLGQSKATLPEALDQYRQLLRAAPNDAALRAEYRKLLLWDPANLPAAIEEYEQLAAERPHDRGPSLQLARLLAQDPRRSAEAIARYRKLVAETPEDRALRLEFARALARDPDLREEALSQLREAHPEDFAGRRLLAQLVAADEARRPEGLGLYRALVEEQPDNDAVRTEYARLLGAKKETAKEAIRQYEKVLARHPDNEAARGGLARAYAWEGDNDRALEQGRVAVEQGSADPELRALARRLGTGREPRVGAGFTLLAQQGTNYGLLGLRVPAQLREEITTHGTLGAQAGVETYRDDLGATATGGFFALDGEVRFDPGEKLRAGFSYQSMRPGVSSLNGLAELSLGGDDGRVVLRLLREPRTDTLRSLVGTTSGPTPGGGVSTNELSARFERKWGGLNGWVVPRIALLAGVGDDVNVEPSLGAGVNLEVFSSDSFRLAVGYALEIEHYGHDASALDAAGYYSPDLHLVQTPRLDLRWEAAGFRIEVGGGPSLQYQLLHDGSGGFLPGGEARASGAFLLSRHLELAVSAAFLRVGSAYSRYDSIFGLSYVF